MGGAAGSLRYDGDLMDQAGPWGEVDSASTSATPAKRGGAGGSSLLLSLLLLAASVAVAAVVIGVLLSRSGIAAAAAAKGLLLSSEDVGLLQGAGVTDGGAVAALTDREFRAAGLDVTACRSAFEAAAVRSMVGGWGLSPAGLESICTARPPLSRQALLSFHQSGQVLLWGWDRLWTQHRVLLDFEDGRAVAEGVTAALLAAEERRQKLELPSSASDEQCAAAEVKADPQMSRALWFAAKAGNEAEVKRLLAAGCNYQWVNCPTAPRLHSLAHLVIAAASRASDACDPAYAPPAVP